MNLMRLTNIFNLVFDCNKTMKKFYLEKAFPNYISKLYLGFFLEKNI